MYVNFSVKLESIIKKIIDKTSKHKGKQDARQSERY